MNVALTNVMKEKNALTGIINATIEPSIIPEIIPIINEDIIKCKGTLYIGGELYETHLLHLYPTGVSVIHS